MWQHRRVHRQSPRPDGGADRKEESEALCRHASGKPDAGKREVFQGGMMTQYRIPKETSKFFVPGEVYLTVVHFCRQYPLWVSELKIDPDSGQAIDYSKEHVQTSSQFDSTSELAMRRVMISQKKQLVDSVAREVAGNMNEWLVMGVGNGLTFFQLRDRGMPCGKDMYYNMRQKFYYELSKRI